MDQLRGLLHGTNMPFGDVLYLAGLGTASKHGDMIKKMVEEWQRRKPTSETGPLPFPNLPFPPPVGLPLPSGIPMPDVFKTPSPFGPIPIPYPNPLPPPPAAGSVVGGVVGLVKEFGPDAWRFATRTAPLWVAAHATLTARVFEAMPPWLGLVPVAITFGIIAAGAQWAGEGFPPSGPRMPYSLSRKEEDYQPTDERMKEATQEAAGSPFSGMDPFKDRMDAMQQMAGVFEVCANMARDVRESVMGAARNVR